MSDDHAAIPWRSLTAYERREKLLGLCDRAEREPLGVDISDYSDEWCAGFLAGQVNALELLIRKEYE